MKISFVKITKEPIKFDIQSGGVKFSGELHKSGESLYQCNAQICGAIPYICDRCGSEFELNLDENVDLMLSDGIYKGSDSLDVIEFFEGSIDIDEILQSEVEAIKSDYFYCDKCKEL
ncbi:DUF177 domain-containing protein [Campylobacter sp. JMF_04 NA10]|uniref:hypothetical protein n=1 Tax=Campylobacter sp. JMF_04 NA10 TaxID=2983824 RepID=UPI0022E9F39A|nr:hypothetical protein [Campylobacter sp. JMF_04 NA10]MDA3077235.1 DUF177 domain-containing protein [Campylobacter sp. JMF_04 NA10]